jgi:hypothetical protein
MGGLGVNDLNNLKNLWNFRLILFEQPQINLESEEIRPSVGVTLTNGQRLIHASPWPKSTSLSNIRLAKD